MQLPKGCSEDWSKMQQVDRGRFCASCQKKVHDLTSSSTMELAQVFKEHNGQLCGRIHPRQLQAYNEFANRQNSVFSFSKLRTAISSISLLIVSICTAPLKKVSAAAFSTYVNHKLLDKNNLPVNEGIPPTDSLRILKLRVLDENGLGAFGAQIEMLDSLGEVNSGPVTDMEGEATLEVGSRTKKIRISSLGYETKDSIILNQVIYLTVKLQVDDSFIDDEVVATGYMNTPPIPLWKRILFYPYYQTKKVYWRLRNYPW